MKKDFTQPLISQQTKISLIVHDTVLDNFLMVLTDGDEEKDYWHELKFDALPEVAIEEQLLPFLYERGLSLVSLRELAYEKRVLFSFVDDTPGSKRLEICFYATVDVVKPKADESFRWVPLQSLVESFKDRSRYYTPFEAGVAQLMSERDYLGIFEDDTLCNTLNDSTKSTAERKKTLKQYLGYCADYVEKKPDQAWRTASDLAELLNTDLSRGLRKNDRYKIVLNMASELQATKQGRSDTTWEDLIVRIRAL